MCYGYSCSSCSVFQLWGGIIPANPVVAYAGQQNNQNGVTIDSNQNISQNTGSSVTNNGNIDDNQGDVDVNNGEINTNNGNVDNNSSTGTIITNSINGTVGENNGTITTNEGTVTDNFGTVGTNNGTVTNNYGGTVGSGTGSVSNQFYSIGVSGENINKSYSGFTPKNGNNYLTHNQNESYVTLTAASGYGLSGTVTSGDDPVTGSGYSYRIFRDSGNSNAFVLQILTPTENLNINLSALGIVSQLISSPTSSESTGKSSNNDSTSESVSDSSGESGLPAGWTVDSDRIYRLIMQSLRERQAYPTQKGSYNIYVGDNPSFDEKAVRSLVDKSEHISWVVFTLNGKAYEILIPSNITPEQREVLINLLKQEPNGEAGPLRLEQLMNQVGIAAKVMEMTGRDLVLEFTGNQSFMEKTTNSFLLGRDRQEAESRSDLKFTVDRSTTIVQLGQNETSPVSTLPAQVNQETYTLDVVSAGPIESLQVAQPNDTLDVTGVGPITSVQPIEVSQVPILPAQVNQETLDVVSAGPIELLQVTQPNDILDVVSAGPIELLQVTQPVNTLDVVSAGPIELLQVAQPVNTLNVVSAGPIESLQVTQPNDTLDVTGVGPITSVQPIEVSQVSTLPAQVNQETTGTVAVAEQPSTLSGWTQEAERIYTLVDTAQKQSIQNGNSVAQVDLGDKPNFDEKATRSFIDKLNTSGADMKFTADGKEYNINVPAGTTVEQREALINLLKQEPNGEAGPARLAQLMWQVGINVTFTERSGRDLVNEFTNAWHPSITELYGPYGYGPIIEPYGLITEPDGLITELYGPYGPYGPITEHQMSTPHR